MKKNIVIGLLIIVILGMFYNLPTKFDGTQGQGVYTIRVYNMFDKFLYDYVIEE